MDTRFHGYDMKPYVIPADAGFQVFPAEMIYVLMVWDGYPFSGYDMKNYVIPAHAGIQGFPAEIIYLLMIWDGYPCSRE